MSRNAKQAVAWARARKGEFGWDNLCLSFVRQAFGIYYSPDAEWPTHERQAGRAWDRAKRKHKVTDPDKIPFGVPVFFELPTEADHVVLSTGDGWCIGNDFVVDGRIDTARISDIADRWGPLLGWTEDLVGNTVWTPPKPPAPKFTDVSFQHTSMQFSDTDKQMASDVEKIFSRGRMILTGTEAGGEKAQPLPDLLREAAKAYGYRFHLGKGDWLAVHRDLIDGGWEDGFVPVLESHEGFGKHTDRGVPWASWNNKQLGRMSIGCGHYLTNGRKPGDPNYALNTRYAEAVGDWAREKGAGKAIAFYGGDQNIVDRTDDTFRGSPLTSAWDELGRYENTGHGNIDVIASYDGDGRVEARTIQALDDRELHLHTDHFLVEAVYRIHHLK